MRGILAIVPALFAAQALAQEEVRFVGTWIGKWERGQGHRLVVERVDGRKATFVYRAGESALSEDISRAKRSEGVIVGNVLYGKSPQGASVTYVMSADGSRLVGHYVREERNIRGEFTRR
jgi:hypothetical protein